MDSSRNGKEYVRLPPWLRQRLPTGREFGATCREVRDRGLHTVCQSARCPNMFECFSRKVATFLVMGGVCTRNCAFCNIAPGVPEPLDADEPLRVAGAARELGLSHVVVTSVTRDDLPDGGAAHFAAVIRAVRDELPAATVEVLIPDFQGSAKALQAVLDAGPDIVNHNVETVPRLYPRIRPQADYGQSLELLRRVSASGTGVIAKAGLMVGLGEEDGEVREVIRDLADTGAAIVTVGQYMRPSREHPPVERYVHPDVFEEYAAFGREQGVRHMYCAPLVRSSYNAEKVLAELGGEA